MTRYLYVLADLLVTHFVNSRKSAVNQMCATVVRIYPVDVNCVHSR